MIKNINERTITVKMSRRELIDTLIALQEVGRASNSKKWEALHDKLQKMLLEFDEKAERSEL